jgi:starch phosphorylase
MTSAWITDLHRLHDLEPLARDASFQKEFLTVKRRNKERLAKTIKTSTGVTVDCDALFDIQVKRIHEYKRQLLNALHIVHRYLCLVEDGEALTPRTCVFAGKAAPGYQAAKGIIRLINDIADVINADRRAQSSLRVVFVPDYRVTLAEEIIPAADLSEQISTAGTEASGTSNMKFAMNGALTMATLDGANIEIREEVGPENIFIFGLTVEEIQQRRGAGPYQPYSIYERSPIVRRILDAFKNNRFCPREPGRHQWVWNKLLAINEPYFHLADLESYLQSQAEAARLYRDRPEWAARAIYNVARMGKFSSDFTIQQYAADIWDIQPVR